MERNKVDDRDFIRTTGAINGGRFDFDKRGFIFFTSLLFEYISMRTKEDQ